MSILTAEYDFDTAIAVKQEEAYASGLSVGLETGREEGISLGREEGVYQTKLETARKLIVRGDSPEDVAQLLDLSLLEIQRLMNN